MLGISNETKDAVIKTADVAMRFIMNMLLVCPDCRACRIHGSINHTDNCRIGQFLEIIGEIVLDNIGGDLE